MKIRDALSWMKMSGLINAKNANLCEQSTPARKTPAKDTLRETKFAHPLEKKNNKPTNPKQQGQKAIIELKFWIKLLLSPLGFAK